MKTEIVVKPEFSYLDDFIRQIPPGFTSLGQEIYSARNEVRLVNVDGLVFAIKYFKKMTLANRYIYAHLRKSKARRAFEHSDMLLSNGITSPKSVAYIDCYKYGMLYQCYYVSLYSDYSPLEEMLKLPISESEPGLKAFARFIYRVHKIGIFHNDLTLTNILYSNKDGVYDFSLIDNNRIKLHRYSFKRGMNNLKRLNLSVEWHGIIAAEYAQISDTNDLQTLMAMVFFRQYFLARISLKRWIKFPLKILLKKR